jgi:glutamate racemase
MAAARRTRNKRVGVIGTRATVESRAYETAIARIDPTVTVSSQSCPLFVPLVESGWLNGSVCRMITEQYLDPLKQQGMDALILGCTHYPLLKATIARVMGSKVQLIDSAQQVALKAKEILREGGLEAPAAPHQRRGTSSAARTVPPRSWRNGAGPARRFFVTDEPRHFEKLSRQFLGRSPGDVSKADVTKL